MRQTGTTLISLAIKLLVCRFSLAHSTPLPLRPFAQPRGLDPLTFSDASQFFDLATLGQDSVPDAATPMPDTLISNLVTDTEVLFEPPTTVTVPATTFTDVITLLLSSAAPSPTSPFFATQTSPPTRATWAAPAQMSDMSSFNISSFAAGHQNFRLVNGIPANATGSPSPSPTPSSDGGLIGLLDGIGALLESVATPKSPPADKRYTAWSNDTTAMELLYPAGSANPSARPQGGAEFYASPLPITEAQTVTMAYSVFFPNGFDWVRGGKLPGLYGGRRGCSGGDSALDCFSTRLMWRKRGEGELYLYAMKDKQTKALCDDPQSECNAQYGFSIGRGSFRFATGMWTHVEQIVTLNTPGKQDGIFTLFVNGIQVIHREDIFYRDAPAGSPQTSAPPSKTTQDSGGGIGGLIPTLGLGPILGGLVGIARRSVLLADPVPVSIAEPTTPIEELHLLASPGGVILSPYLSPPPLEFPSDQRSSDSTSADRTTSPSSEQASKSTSKPVGFVGIFFSTFFGGHGPTYTTPVDQYVWFRAFSLTSDA